MFMDAIGGGKNAMSSAPNWFLKFGRRGRTNQNCCMKRKTRLGDSVQQARSASVSILLCFFFPYKPLGSSRRSDYAKWSPFSPFYNECWLAWLWLFVKSYDYVILFNIKSSHVMHKLLLLHPKLALRWSCVPLWTLASPVWKNMDHMVRTCSNGSCWIQGVRSGAFGHVDLTIQMYPNDPKCIYFYPRLTRCHSHPHIWLPAGVLWAGSSGHKTEGRLGSKLQRLDLPAAWQMGCCAVWSWFGLRTTDYHCTSSWGTKKQGRSLAWVASGKIWQDMARYGKIWQDPTCFYNTVIHCVNCCVVFLGSFTSHGVKRGGRRLCHDLSLKRDHMIQASNDHTPCLLHSFMVWL